MVNTEKQQADEVTNVFRELFEKDNQGTAKQYSPCSTKRSSTEEISIASNKLRNSKSLSLDNMYGEYIKYAPETTRQIIAGILRKSAETDDYLEILKEGILTPLQRPPKKKKKGEKKTNNLKPVILLLTVTKYLQYAY